MQSDLLRENRIFAISVVTAQIVAQIDPMFGYVTLSTTVVVNGAIQNALAKRWVFSRQSQSPYKFFLSGCCCSRGEDLVHQKLKYFHET